MTKRNKILVSVLCACVAALLVAVCCLGFTFARYTTTESETAEVGIAKWSISLTEDDSNVTDSTVTFNSIKPNADAFDAAGKNYDNSTNPRTSNELLYIGTLTNSGEVDATVTANGVTLTATGTSDTTYGSDAINNHITIKVLYSTTSAEETDAGQLSDLSESYTLTASSSIYIYFDVVWTSDLSTDTNLGADGDAFDTWMAENVTALTATVSFDVVQAS